MTQAQRAAAMIEIEALEAKLDKSIARRMVESIRQEKYLRDAEKELEEVKKKKLR